MCVCVCGRVCAMKGIGREPGLAACPWPLGTGQWAHSPLGWWHGAAGEECGFGGGVWTDSRAVCSKAACGGKEHQLGRETVQELRTGAGRHGDGQVGNGHELQTHGATECQAACGVCEVGRLPPSWLLPTMYTSEQLKQRSPPSTEGLQDLLQRESLDQTGSQNSYAIRTLRHIIVLTL